MKTGEQIYALVKVGIDNILEQKKEHFIGLLTQFALADDGNNFVIANFQAVPVGVVQSQIIIEVTGIAIEKQKQLPVENPAPEQVAVPAPKRPPTKRCQEKKLKSKMEKQRKRNLK